MGLSASALHLVGALMDLGELGISQATASCPRVRGSAGALADSGLLRGRLLLLLELATSARESGPVTSATEPRALHAVVAGRLAPARRRDSVLLPGQGYEIFDFCAPKPSNSPIRFSRGGAIGGVAHSRSARPPQRATSSRQTF
jgi:hypothetical protein